MTRGAPGFGPRIRKSPFFEATRRWGCEAYTVYNHMYMPLHYGDPVADYWRLVEDVTLWDVAAERQVEITGPDAARLAQLLTPRELSRCAAGQCRYVLITDERGGVVNDPLLLRLGERHFWLSAADSDLLLWAKGLALASGMDVSVREPDVSPLQVQGPRSVEVMRDLLGEWITGLRYFRFRETALAGISILVSCSGWSGELGFEVFLRDGSRGDELWERIMEAGRAHRIAPGAPSQIRRIEAGMLSYGADMTLENNPFELALERLVDLEQPADFVGKAARARIKAEGVARRLVGVEIEGEPLAAGNEHPWPLAGDALPTRGKVTSCVHSPRLRKNIGLALVPAARCRPATPLRVTTPEEEREATVAPLPFVKPAAR